MRRGSGPNGTVLTIRKLISGSSAYNPNTMSWEVYLRTTFTIELKMDVADDAQQALMHQLLKTAAQGLFAQAAMLSGKRPPQIALRSENSFVGQTDIELHSSDDN